jgi:redox-sensitive bicupin YhaK (pirin superfamily)
MQTLRKSEDRGRTRTDWLDSRHTFSFGNYYDPRHAGFRDLLVINEDRVVPGAGFPTHPHRDMEIVSYVLSGALEHKDSLGTGSVIRPRELQRMSAGTGIRHSEYNASATEPVHFLQIWIVPERSGLPPGYEQKRLPGRDGSSGLDLIGSRNGRHGSVSIRQDVDLLRAVVQPNEAVSYVLRDGRAAWVQAVAGRAWANGALLEAGDGLAVSGEPSLEIRGETPAELLVFDLA